MQKTRIADLLVLTVFCIVYTGSCSISFSLSTVLIAIDDIYNIKSDTEIVIQPPYY